MSKLSVTIPAMVTSLLLCMMSNSDAEGCHRSRHSQACCNTENNCCGLPAWARCYEGQYGIITCMEGYKCYCCMGNKWVEGCTGCNGLMGCYKNPPPSTVACEAFKVLPDSSGKVRYCAMMINDCNCSKYQYRLAYPRETPDCWQPVVLLNVLCNSPACSNAVTK